MADNRSTAPPITALTALRRHWLVAILIVVVVGAMGAGVAMLKPNVYTAESRLAVGAGEMSTLAIPGFPTASRDLASNYARWVTLQGVGGTAAPPGTLSLAASPIPDSNVLRIEAKAENPDIALAAAGAAGKALVAEVLKVKTDNDPKALLDQVGQSSPALARAQAEVTRAHDQYRTAFSMDPGGSARVRAALEAYVKAETQRQKLDAQRGALLERYRRVVSQRTTEADLRLIGPGAAVVGHDRNSRIQRYLLLGLVAGSLLAAAAAYALERRRLTRPGQAGIDSE